MEINIKMQEVGEDPAIPIYHVELRTEHGVWTETFGHRSLLEAFVRGVRAGLGVHQIYIPEPELSRE